MEHFDPLYCTVSAAQKAEDLIATETVDTVRNYSLDAGQVYKWVRTPLSLSQIGLVFGCFFVSLKICNEK